MTEIITHFKTSVFLSTDGKHTVNIEVSDPAFLTEALSKASTIYDSIVAKYGLQPARSAGGFKPAAPKVSAGTCQKHNVPMVLNKNGKPYHRDQQRGFCNGRGFQDEQAPQNQNLENQAWEALS